MIQKCERYIDINGFIAVENIFLMISLFRIDDESLPKYMRIAGAFTAIEIVREDHITHGILLSSQAAVSLF